MENVLEHPMGYWLANLLAVHLVLLLAVH
jgi:hypothetical protein